VLDAARERFEYAGAWKAPLAVVSGGDDPLRILRARSSASSMCLPADGPSRRFASAIDAGSSFFLALTMTTSSPLGIDVADEGALVGVSWHRGISRVRPPLSGDDSRLFGRHARAAVLGMRRMGDMVASSRRSVRSRYPAVPIRAMFTYCRVVRIAALVRTSKQWASPSMIC
jgi:hypothetical protein